MQFCRKRGITSFAKSIFLAASSLTSFAACRSFFTAGSLPSWARPDRLRPATRQLPQEGHYCLALHDRPREGVHNPVDSTRRLRIVSPYAKLSRKSRPILHLVCRYRSACLTIEVQIGWPPGLRFRCQVPERDPSVFRTPVPSTDDFKPDSLQTNGSIEKRTDSGLEPRAKKSKAFYGLHLCAGRPRSCGKPSCLPFGGSKIVASLEATLKR